MEAVGTLNGFELAGKPMREVKTPPARIRMVVEIIASVQRELGACELLRCLACLAASTATAVNTAIPTTIQTKNPAGT
jgi:hypothetical protein